MSDESKVLHFGVLGEVLVHSLSPEIHHDLFRQQGINATYEKYEMDHEQVNHVLDFMKENDIMGMNVTMPYKENLYRMVDHLDEHVQVIGAVNTVFIKDGESYGFNTDWIGVTSMFEKAGVDLADKRIVVLGSGGACRALIYGFHAKGAASITIAARNEQQKAHLKESFPYIETCTMDDIPDGDIIINTTPVGMYPKVGVSAVGPEVVRRFKVASDIVYNPLVTEFLRIAQEEGLQVVTGFMMLVDQAIGSEEIWLNKKLDYAMGNSIHDELVKQFL